MSEEKEPINKEPRKVVYLLGTGFSAPLGLPTMSNWTAKAQSMIYNRPGYEMEGRANVSSKFKILLDKVTQQAESLSISKNYYTSDLFNMEDLFSMLWIRAELRRDEPIDGPTDYRKAETPQDARDTYIRYIRKVINYYTPGIGLTEKLRSNWRQSLFGLGRTWNLYGLFFAALFNIEFYLKNNKGDIIKPTHISFNSKPNPPAKYTIITTNYDRVPNIPIEHIANMYADLYAKDGQPLDYCDGQEGRPDKPQSDPRFVRLAKIHGDVKAPKGKNSIVPPIANKSGLNAEALKLAADALQEATDLRIIGYSLPETDTYIKYLLRAVITNSNLQNVHVIVKDSSHAVQKRYDNFICCTNYQFVNGDVLDYLKHHMSLYKPEDRNSRNLKLDKLEQAHFEYMQQKRR